MNTPPPSLRVIQTPVTPIRDSFRIDTPSESPVRNVQLFADPSTNPTQDSNVGVEALEVLLCSVEQKVELLEKKLLLLNRKVMALVDNLVLFFYLFLIIVSYYLVSRRL